MDHKLKIYITCTLRRLVCQPLSILFSKEFEQSKLFSLPGEGQLSSTSIVASSILCKVQQSHRYVIHLLSLVIHSIYPQMEYICTPWQGRPIQLHLSLTHIVVIYSIIKLLLFIHFAQNTQMKHEHCIIWCVGVVIHFFKTLLK